MELVSTTRNFLQSEFYTCQKHSYIVSFRIAEIYSLDLYNDKLLRFIAKYKFVIAFENGICDDYITEKLWRPLFTGTVPIYLGSPSVQVSFNLSPYIESKNKIKFRTGYRIRIR
jgi:hypothetical protein